MYTNDEDSNSSWTEIDVFIPAGALNEFLSKHSLSNKEEERGRKAIHKPVEFVKILPKSFIDLLINKNAKPKNETNSQHTIDFSGNLKVEAEIEENERNEYKTEEKVKNEDNLQNKFFINENAQIKEEYTEKEKAERNVEENVDAEISWSSEVKLSKHREIEKYAIGKKDEKKKRKPCRMYIRKRIAKTPKRDTEKDQAIKTEEKEDGGELKPKLEKVQNITNLPTISKNRILSSKHLLIIRINSQGKKGVFTKQSIPKGGRFGPLQVNDQPTKAYSWMKLINYSKYVSAYNLIGYRENDGLYYRSIRKILENEELVVNFSDEIIKSVGLKSDKCTLNCVSCKMYFYSIPHFIIHRMWCCHTTKSEVTLCPLCKVEMTDPKFLKVHMESCSEKQTKRSQEHQCPKNELQKQHGHHSKFLCEVCGMLLSRTSFSSHVAKHSGARPFKCSQCDTAFKSKVSLQTHIRYKHTLERKFSCDKCPLKFVSRYALNKHSRVHANLRPFPCHVCQKRFTRADNRRIHMNIHKNLIFECQKCNYESHYKAILKEHYKKKHGIIMNAYPLETESINGTD